MELSQIIAPLLAWYDGHARKLPWREEVSPYRTWVSEIMLQQTRVSAATEYFNRFMKEMPDIRTLAEADEERLLKLWEGLGYYSRARNMQKAAKLLVKEYNAALPASFELLKKLPGIGEYTAGAIASIAFEIRVPAVDGNVLRVLSRLLNSEADVSLLETKRMLTERLALPQQRVGDFNQALMELGALVCLPNGAPKCEGCPLIALCIGRAAGREQSLPKKAPKAARRLEERTVLLLCKEGRILLRRREKKGLLAGMYEFPTVMGKLSEAQARRAAEALGFLVKGGEPAPEAKHIFTHLEWHMTGWRFEAEGRGPEEAVWTAPEALLERFALPSAFETYRRFLLGK